MSDWLYSLSNINILLVAIFFTVISMFLFHRIFGALLKQFHPAQGHKNTLDIHVDVHGSIVTIASLILSFSLVQVISNHIEVESLASKEATQINNLDRLLVRFGDAKVADIREDLHNYAQSIVDDEWPVLSKEIGSERTRRLFNPLSREVYSIEPKDNRQSILYTQAIQSLDDIAESRDLRIQNVSTKLPIIYWIVISFAFLIKVIVSSLTDESAIQSLIYGLQMAILGALVGLVFIFNQPFKGESSVKPDALKSTIEEMATRAR